MIALIPHIVRKPDITAVDMRGIAAGTDQNVKLSFAPRPDEIHLRRRPPAGSELGTAAAVPTAPATPVGAAESRIQSATVQARLGSHGDTESGSGRT